jgi:hypothetical protein
LWLCQACTLTRVLERAMPTPRDSQITARTALEMRIQIGVALAVGFEFPLRGNGIHLMPTDPRILISNGFREVSHSLPAIGSRPTTSKAVCVTFNFTDVV